MKNPVTYIRQSLSLKLSLMLLFFTVVLFVVSLGSLTVMSRRQIRQDAIDGAFHRLENTSLRLMGFVNEVETAARNMKGTVERHMNPDSFFVYSRRVVELNPDINGCSITAEPYYFKEMGKYFSVYAIRENDTIYSEREVPYDYCEEDWYKKPRMLREPCWTDPYEEADENKLSSMQMIASYGMPLYDHLQQLIGVISVDLSVKNISRIIAEEKIYPHSYFIMVGQTGTFFIHPDSNKIGNETIFSGMDPSKNADVMSLGHCMIEGKEGVMKVEMDGKACQVIYVPLKQTGWSLAIVCPENEIYSDYNKFLHVVISLLAVVLLLLLFACRWIVGRYVAPLNKLDLQSQRIARGEDCERLPVSRGFNSISRLQNAFATMQSSLEQNLQRIQQMNAKAEERNKELVITNQKVVEASHKKTAFIQNMTHQIRTPLNIIMGYTQVLRDNYMELPQEETKSLLAAMEHNTVTITRMIAMLIDSSVEGHAQVMSREDYVSCNDVAREAVEDARRQFHDAKRFVLETMLVNSLHIYTNRLYMFRVLRELLYNSAKFSTGEVITMYVQERARTVVFIIEDEGPGIPEQYQKVLFDQFYKRDDFSEGLGLGLPLTKRHAQRLGGDLRLDTSYKKGCRFVVEIPKESDTIR